MKQKRKVKSLIPQKENFNWGFLTALLFVLWVALCLWAASLMSTSSVWAAKLWRDISTLSYSGVDDVVEVLYNLDFAKPEDLEKKVAKMYINNNKDFYLQTSIPLVVNAEDTIGDSLKENQVIAWEKSNILWWYGNRVRGSNVTIIWWNENVMESIDGWSFDNSVIFWWENIKLRDGNGFPAIIVWWKNHQVEPGHNWIAIVWWETQQINDKGAKNVVLIWWTEIDVNGENAENIVVWWKNIDVNEWINNVFVFSSDWSFVPQSSWAFYLNVAKGLWINTQALGKWITTNGPVKIGEVDINTVCSTSNLGVIGAWKVDSKISCLVWCSKTSAWEVWGPWEMLDRGKDCEIACDNNPSRCSQKHVDIPEVASYTGFCVKPGWMSLDNSSPCTPDEWGNYENAFFEAWLIDSTVDCPFGAANKCVYKCNTGYHLTWDRTNQFNAYTNKNQKCFKDCNLVEQLGGEWIDGNWKPIILKHNQMVTGYNTDIAVCARTNPYDWTDRWTKGDAFPEHCGNNQHKKPLVCVNGEMRIANNYTSPWATSTNAKSAGYWHRYCQTAPFACDTGKFDLSRSDVTTTLIDSVSSWQSTDRSTSQWTRWKYKLCLDYKTWANYTTAPGNEAAWCVIVQSQPYEVHYKFEWCQAGYRQSNRNSSPIDRSGDDYRVCRKQCKVTTQDGITRTINDNTTITLYKTNSEDCSKWNSSAAWWLCDAHTFICDDGNWKSDGYNINDYKYYSCTENGRLCSDYKVSALTMGSAEHSYYSSACHKWVPYTPEPSKESKTYTNWNPEVIACDYQRDWYQLIGCDPCYHTEDNQKCTYDYKDGSSCPFKSNAKTIGSIYYSWWWSSWNSSSSMGTHDSCSYVCNPGYYDNGNWCTESTGPSDEYGCSNKPKDWSWYDVETRTTTHDNAVWTYYVKVWNTWDNKNKILYTGSECFSSCDVGYTKYKSMCIKWKFWQIECAGKVPYHATASDNWTTVSDNWYYHIWDGDCWFYCDEWYYWDTKYNACAKNECDANPCKIVVNYDFDGWDWSPSQEIVSCKGSITLPKTNRSCYTFNWWIGAWYVGKVWTIPFNETATRTINFTADWTRNTSECPYTCKWTEPSGIYVNKNSDVNWDAVDWKPLENYSTDLSRCQWRCISNEYYMDKDNVTCRKKKCAPDPTWQNIKLWDKEFLSATISDGKSWGYTDSQNPGACQWTCQDGYTRAKDAAGNWLNYCEAKKCGWTPWTGPKVITWVWEYTWTVTKNWHSVTGTTAPWVCEWTCQGGWVPSWNTCILDENAQCKNSENPTANGQTTGCISGTVVKYDATTLENKKTWSCKSKTNSSETSWCRHCKSWYTWTNCDKIENWKCNNSEKYKCFTWEVMGTGEDKTNHKYTWECDGVNGWSRATWCFKCFDEYEYNTATKRCEPVSKWDCGKVHVPYNCASWTSWAALFKNHKYTWDCIWSLSTDHCMKCEDEYILIDGECVKCLWWYQEGTTCIVDLECEKTYGENYTQVGNECLAYWSCFDADWKIYDVRNIHMSQSSHEVLPKWKTWNLSCKDKSSDVVPNTCQFSCMDWYECNSVRDWCAKSGPSCWTSDWTWSYSYDWWTEWRLPTEKNQSYVEVTKSQLDEIVKTKKKWCYIACDEGWEISSLAAWTCKSKNLKCKTSVSRWNVRKHEWTPKTESETSWKYVDKSSYDSYVSNWSACIWTCDEGKELHPNKISTFTSLFTYDAGKDYNACWRQCENNEYFSIDFCYDVALWFEPDPTKKITYDWITNYYWQRLIDCWSNAVFNNDLRACLKNWTLSQAQCEALGDWWMFYAKKSQCVKCMSSSQHFDFTVWQCV